MAAVLLLLLPLLLLGQAEHGSPVPAPSREPRLIPPAFGPPRPGIFTHMDNLNWEPGYEQLKKQGGWWLQSLVHYDSAGNVLHQHRVTAEIFLNMPVGGACA
jgi:hypothetical protein